MWWFYALMITLGVVAMVAAMMVGDRHDLIHCVTVVLVAYVGKDLCDLKRKG